MKNTQDGVQQADLGGIGRFIDVHETPDDARADEGDRHRDEKRRLDDTLDPHPIDQYGNQQAQPDGQRGGYYQPEQVVLDDIEQIRVGEDRLVISQRSEERRVLVLQAENEGVDQ